MASAVAEEWNFDAIMKDKVIGKHTFSVNNEKIISKADFHICLLYTSPSPRDATLSRMPSSA